MHRFGMERFIAQRQRNPAFGAERRTGDAQWYNGPMVGLKRVRDNAKMQRAPGYKGPDKCWDGFEAVEGELRGNRGSCRRKKRKKRASKTTEGKESSTDASSSSDDEKKEKK